MKKYIRQKRFTYQCSTWLGYISMITNIPTIFNKSIIVYFDYREWQHIVHDSHNVSGWDEWHFDTCMMTWLTFGRLKWFLDTIIYKHRLSWQRYTAILRIENGKFVLTYMQIQHHISLCKYRYTFANSVEAFYDDVYAVWPWNKDQTGVSFHFL